MESMHEFDPYQLAWQISTTLAYVYEQCDDLDSQTDGKRHLRLDCLFYNKIFEHFNSKMICIENLQQTDLRIVKYKKHKSKNIIVKRAGNLINF